MTRRTSDVVAVVVPQAGTHAEVATLIASLAQQATPYRLVLVDGATTELRQGALRKRLAARTAASCVWLRARRPGALPALAAAAAEASGDVVLVDPRIRLPAGWLDRLQRCAASDPAIGVVGTWSTAASGAPGFATRLAIGGRWHRPDDVDDAIAGAAIPVYPNAGIVAGPCVFIRRAVLDAARATNAFTSLAAVTAVAHRLGLRSALADDVVAQHVPSAFDPGEPDPADANVGAALAAVGAHDPIAPLRTVLASTLAMLDRRDLPGVLHVAHARGGGTEHFLRNAIAVTGDAYRHYVLRIHADRWTLEDAGDDRFAVYDWPRAGPDAGDGFLRDACAWLRIDLVHVHSLVGSGDDFLRAIELAAVAYLYSAHDMYVPCPTIYLIDSGGRYCRATTDLATCTACLAGMPALAGVDVAGWRERYARFLARAKLVIGPSPWAAATIRTYYPDATVEAVPYGSGPPLPPPAPDADASAVDALLAADAVDPTPAPVPPTSRPIFDLPRDAHRHVGVLGAVGPEKGSRRIDAMVERIRERDLPLRIVVIGYTDRECRFQSDDRVLTVHGPYDRGEVASLCDAYRVDVLAFPSIWPETFCYAMSEGWAAGRPALVPAYGALGDRVSATQAGWTIDPEADVDAWLDRLVAVTAPAHADDLAAKAENARAADAAWRAAPDPIAAVYARFARRGAAAAHAVEARHAIYAAACRAAGVEPLPAARAPAAAQTDATPAAGRRGGWLGWLRSLAP